jgi:nicotinamidase-related amidase
MSYFIRRAIMMAAAFALVSSTGSSTQAEPLRLKLRSQTETAPGSQRFHVVERAAEWNPQETAVIICDVWDYHHCLNAVRRLEEFGPRLNDVVAKARAQGCTIIHAPSDCMPSYVDHPARARAIAAPKAPSAPPEITRWCSIVPSEKQAIYPLDQSDGGEDDDPKEHAEWAAKLAALGRNPKLPWKKQSDMVKIDDTRDFISDKGDEVWNVLESRGIKNVVLVGVHLNMCVLGRPFGLRRMIEGGKNAVLLRDLTDTMYNPKMWPYVPHFTGNDRMVAHVEQRVCPTITSDQILADGSKPFRFAADKRPHVAIVVAEEGYNTAQTLPDFANRYLGDFRVSYVFGSATEPNSIPGLEVLDEADAVILSVRRKVLKPEQMAIVKRFVAAKKPVIGIRTTSHAFSLRPDVKTPEGYEAWPTFDVDVLGMKYLGHSDSKSPAEIHRINSVFTVKNIVYTMPRQIKREGGLYLFESLPAQDRKVTVNWIGEQDGKKQPVAWSFVRADGGTSYYTSLGEASDVDDEKFVRLLASGVYAATGQSLPEPLPRVSREEELKRHWTMFDVPNTSQRNTIRFYDGPYWARCVVRIPSSWSRDGITLELPDRVAGLDDGHGDQVWFNGNPVLEKNGYRIDAEAVNVGEANLLVVRRSAKGMQTLAGKLIFAKAPILKHGDDSIKLAGKWRFRLGDDPAWSNMPLPARFGAATDYIIEAAAK